MLVRNEAALDDRGLGPEGAGASSFSESFQAIKKLVPGSLSAVAVAALATVLGSLVPVVGAPVIAIVIGMAISSKHKGETLRPGLVFTSKKVLQSSIVVMGTALSLRQVLSVGGRSLPVLIGTLIAGLGMTFVFGKLLGVRGDVRTLIGVGTAICGASAIAAANAVLEADEAEVSYAVATIFTFNVAAVLLYPTLGHIFSFSQHTFGLWAGTAINDLSSVVAASTIYGHTAASYGVIVKLTRTLAIIPICLGLAAWSGHRKDRINGKQTQVQLMRIMPLFIVAFLGAVILNTVGLIPAGWHHGLSDLSIWMITAALAAIGLSADLAHVKNTGFRPLALGALLWVTVGAASLGLQAMSGML